MRYYSQLRVFWLNFTRLPVADCRPDVLFCPKQGIFRVALNKRNVIICLLTKWAVTTMRNWQAVSDKAAISLSVACAIHCLIVPVALVLMPSVASLALADESFHVAILVAVIPASLVALTLGCRRHQRYRVTAIGGVGLVVLVVAALAGHNLFGAWGEKVLTLLGALIVATSHVGNYRLCQSHRCAPAPYRVPQ